MIIIFVAEKRNRIYNRTVNTDAHKERTNKMSAKVKESNLKNKIDIMRITTRDDAIPMKDVQNGTEIAMTAYVIEEVTKDRGADPSGEVFECILVQDSSGAVYATRSETFIEKIRDIMDELMEGEDYTLDLKAEPLMIRITQQKSRSGNNFVSCSLA